jgi:HK97 gp10 family phage protein
MADGLNFNLLGQDKVINVLGKVETKMSILILEAIVTAARNTLEDSQYMVPVDTGDLKASGHMIVGELLAAVVYGDGSQTDKIYDYGDYQADGYAWFQELGTTKMAAQPFLYPAFEDNAYKLLEDIHGILAGDITI